MSKTSGLATRHGAFGEEKAPSCSSHVSPRLGFQRWPALLCRSPEGIFCSRLGGGDTGTCEGDSPGDTS